MLSMVLATIYLLPVSPQTHGEMRNAFRERYNYANNDIHSENAKHDSS